MNIKIADRLVKLRKENGYSQEELAEKLGLSRQAVSKWERAEASPDTDNLICLAKLYKVSLDELLQDDDDIETIVKEQVKGKTHEGFSKTEEEPTKDEEKQDESKIHFDDNGIHTEDGNEKVHIDCNGVHVFDGKDEVHIDRNGIHVNENGNATYYVKNKRKTKTWLIVSIITGSAFFVALLAMILIGCLVPGGWNWSWTFMLLVPVVISIPEAIEHRRISTFAYPFLVTFIYFLICLGVTPIWHPLWVIFISIPVFYSIVCPIDKYNKSKRNPYIIDATEDDGD